MTPPCASSMATPCGSVTLAEILSRAQLTTLDDDSWVPLASACPEVVLHRMDTLLRARYEIPLSYSDALLASRPENFFHSIRPSFDRYMSECEVEHVVAPG